MTQDVILAPMKIAIVNPNSAEVQALIQLLREQRHAGLPLTTVCWFTRDGASAIARCRLDPPDVLLLDLNLKGENGVEITQKILTNWPTCKVLVASSSLARHATQAYAAVSAGAFDVVTLPPLPEPSDARTAALRAWKTAAEPLLEKLSTLQKLLQSRRLKSEDRHRSPSPAKAGVSLAGASAEFGSSVPAKSSFSHPPLIVIGASTGGPKAIAQLLSPFPADFPAAFVIVQHVSARFATSLADWLQKHTALKMTPITAGSVPTAGQVAIAAEDRHLVLRGNQTFGYREQSPDLHYCPSVNLFFETVAQHWPHPGIAIVLTGMGKDGAEGMKQLRDRGWYTFAQDEASSSIHSMPRAAIETGSVVQVLDPTEMAQVCFKKLAVI